MRLPTFQFDPTRGRFDTWLFHIVQGKTANVHRASKRRLLQGNANALQTAPDQRPGPGKVLEEDELVEMAWTELKKRLSACTFRVLHLRLVEG